MKVQAWVVLGSLAAVLGGAGCSSSAGSPAAPTQGPGSLPADAPASAADVGAPADTAAPAPDVAPVDVAVAKDLVAPADVASPLPDAVAPAVDVAAAPDVAAPVDVPPADAGPPCATAADCPIATNPCRPKACVNGACAYPAVADGTPCDDDNACTAADICLAGTCTPQETLGTTLLPAWGHGATAWAMLAAPGGGFVIAGEAIPSLGGTTDAWLTRTGGDGSVKWQANFGGEGTDTARGLVDMPDGGYALAGSSQGTLGLDGMVVRTDDSGKALWTTTWGGKLDDEFHGLAVLPDGKLIAAGQTHSKGAGGADAWLVGLSATGAVLWESVYGGAQDDDAAAVVRAPAGGVLVVGTTRSPSGLSDDVWVLRADATGKTIWQKTFGGKMDERAWAAVALPDGGFAVLGETGASKTPGNGIDFWLLRLDASGKLLWDSTYGGSEGERGYGIASLADGGFVLTGYTGTYGDGLWSTWVVRTDAAGQMHWQQAYGSPEMDHGQAIVGLTGGGFAIAGQIHDAKAAIDQGLLVRADHWGSAACTTAGPCLKLTLSDCDDNKPCTSDNCRSTPPLGCWHADMPAGAWCGDGMSCKAATCSIAP